MKSSFSKQPEMEIKPIGTITSCYKQKFGTPRQPGLVAEARATLKILPEYQPEISLSRLTEFSHLWVIFVFHDLKDYSFHAKVHPPRMEGESIGLFATRSPHRPNPVGLSLVKIGKIENGEIELWGGDFVEGTPVIDIKPYLKEVESIPDARSGWAEGLSHFKKNLTFSYSEQSETVLGKISLEFLSSHESAAGYFKQVFEKTVALDPRPQVYKDLDREHVLRLWSWDVFFTMTDSLVQVDRIIRL